MNHRNQKSYRPRTLLDLGNQKSCTVPGQETNLRQLLAQHSRGMPLPSENEGQYFGDMDVPDFEEMDILELREYTMGLREEINDIKQELQRQEWQQNNPVTAKEKPEATGNPTSKPDASTISP